MSCIKPAKIRPKSDVGTAKEGRVVYGECRNCPPCRAKQQREWTRRMKDELTLHLYASFVTSYLFF